jgi:hypothetical protein
MATAVSNIIPAKYAEDSQTTQYTSTAVQTIIDKFTVTNDSGGDVTIGINLVASGDSAGGKNLIVSRTVLDGKVDRCPELIGHVLESGDFISTIAGSASDLAIMSSGRKVS